MAQPRAKPHKYPPTNAVEAYILRDARIKYIGTYFDLRRKESPRDFLAFSKRRWLTLDNLAHVNSTDLEKQVPPRDHLHCPENITRVDPALLLCEEIVAKGAEEDATEDAAFEDNESIPANVINWIESQQKRLHEVHICELLAKSPHPNIVKYYGCDVRGDYIHHLILEYVPHKLADRFLDKSKPLDVEKCIRGIEAGLNHMHSLGLVHLDIAPRNIMLRQDDTPVIIDFDLTQRDGERLVENFHAGEPYYHTYDTHASLQLDIGALDLLKEWLRHTPRVVEAAWRHITWPKTFPTPDNFAPPSEPNSNESTGSSATQQSKPVESASKEPQTYPGSRSRSNSSYPTRPLGLTASPKAPATTSISFKSTSSIPNRKRKKRKRSSDEDLDASQCPYLCPECGFHARGDKKTEKKSRKGKQKNTTQESSSPSQRIGSPSQKTSSSSPKISSSSQKTSSPSQKKNSPSQKKNSPSQETSSPGEGTSSPSQKTRPRCSNCSGIGHNMKTCAEPCSLCWDEGHKRRECPLKLEAGQQRN